MFQSTARLLSRHRLGTLAAALGTAGGALVASGTVLGGVPASAAG
jgi:hypothetical protein